jgi:hypothetical protein
MQEAFLMHNRLRDSCGAGYPWVTNMVRITRSITHTHTLN